MAIEDGMVLARCLERFAPEEALQRYQQARLARTNSIVVKSSENAKRFHNPRLADAAIWTVAAFEHTDPEAIMDAFTPWRSLDPDPLEPHLETILGDQATWQGTATDLLKTLQSANVPNLPQTPKGLSQRLNQMDPTVIEPLLLRLKTGERRIRLTRIKDASKPPPVSPNPHHSQPHPALLSTPGSVGVSACALPLETKIPRPPTLPNSAQFQNPYSS